MTAKKTADEIGPCITKPGDDVEGQYQAASGVGDRAGSQHEEPLLKTQAQAHVERTHPGDGLAGQGLLYFLIKKEGTKVDEPDAKCQGQPQGQDVRIQGPIADGHPACEKEMHQQQPGHCGARIKRRIETHLPANEGHLPHSRKDGHTHQAEIGQIAPGRAASPIEQTQKEHRENKRRGDA